MLDFIPSFFRRHQKKLLFLGGVIGGITFFNTYLKNKFIDWETKRSIDMYDQLNKASYFENTMITCDSMYISFCGKIRLKVMAEYDVDSIVSKLKNKPDNKVELWDELKVYVFTQVMGEMYANCILCVLLRVQMVILSGYIFSTRSTSTGDTQHQLLKYMSLVEEFMMKGMLKLLKQVEVACTLTLKDQDLYKPLRLRDFENIFMKIQEKVIESDLTSSLHLLDFKPSDINENTETVDVNVFNDILIETRDVLECDDFKKVLNLCISCGIEFIMDMISGIYTNVSSKEQFKNINTYEIKLAKLIPLINNQFSNVEISDNDSLPHKLIQLEKLNNFAANIYEAFSQKSS